MDQRKQGDRLEVVLTIKTEDTLSSVRRVASAIADEHSDFYFSPEQRIARLEAQIEHLVQRLSHLQERFAQHTHDVPSVSVGFLSEPINGRRIELAINPRGTTRRSGPPIAAV